MLLLQIHALAMVECSVDEAESFVLLLGIRSR